MGTEEGGHPSRTISMQNNPDVLEYKQAWEEASLAGCGTSNTKGKYTEVWQQDQTTKEEHRSVP